MFLLNFFKNFLASIGFFKKHGKIIFLGLDNAGKTTLLKRLKDDKMSQHDPTMFATNEELQIGNIKLKAFDIGGLKTQILLNNNNRHVAARKTWRNYFPNIDGIIYLVDAADIKRLPESKNELEQLYSCPSLRSVPIVVLGNKIDKKRALPEQEFYQQMGLNTIQYEKNSEYQEINEKPIKCFMCSISKRQGYFEAFEWLGQFLK